MLERLFKDPTAVQRWRAGLLVSYLDSFVEAVSDLGYARASLQARMWLLGDLGRWLKRRNLRLADLGEPLVSRFLDGRHRRRCLRRDDTRIARQFLEHLREQGVVRAQEPPIDRAPLAPLGRRYESHLRRERGLSLATVTRYWSFLQRFLVERFGSGPIQLHELTPCDVSGFLLRHARAGTPAGRRNRAILLLLARLGLRAGEVIALELEDIDWRAGVLTVRGKGRFHDRLPLPADVGEAVAAYLRQDRPHCATRRGFIRSRAPPRGLGHASTVGAAVGRPPK